MLYSAKELDSLGQVSSGGVNSLLVIASAAQYLVLIPRCVTDAKLDERGLPQRLHSIVHHLKQLIIVIHRWQHVNAVWNISDKHGIQTC